MKKIFIKSSVLVLTIGLFASCAGHHLCPTYVKNDENKKINKLNQLEETDFASIKK